MRKALKITALAIGIWIALVVMREAFFGYTSYFFMVPTVRLSADGKPAAGWLHRGGKGHILILTLAREHSRESYWINLPNQKKGGVERCNKWTASRFPIVAFGDVFPSCWTITDVDSDSGIPATKSLVNRRFASGPRFVEFTDDNGSRIQVLW